MTAMSSSRRNVPGGRFCRSFEFSFSLGSRRDGGTLRLIYDNGSGAASAARRIISFFFRLRARKEVPPEVVGRVAAAGVEWWRQRREKNCYDLPAGNVNFVLWIR